ncbi:CocE/NonD family hydrolase [Litorivivens sp.]|uniref:CocE/NonD family hydrolase n=1 Tax=Litorivivens sp. TaxID=2020868 RepID=UPI0035643A8E
MKRFFSHLGILGLSISLAACGGGSSSSGGGVSSGGSSSTNSGQFVDGPVKGLSYRRPNNDEVFQTSAIGSFSYLDGETLTFFLGSITLGEVTPSTDFITPNDFGNAAIGIARLLQTLDTDSNPANGIQLSESVRAAAENFSGAVDFTNLNGDLADFARTANGGAARELVSQSDARAHLDSTLADIRDGRIDYDGGVDSDDDGVNDAIDKCPATAGNENFAGCPDSDTLAADDDGDGIANGTDNCPATANEDQLDTDGDSRGDACDLDDDNDGLLDEAEVAKGTDPTLPDTDFDGIGDGDDNCPLAANEDQLDSDRDGDGNVCDEDDDNDGVRDEEDAFPLDPSEDTDTDGDGVGNNADEDDDNDGVNDDEDAFPDDDSETTDTDGDGIGNNADPDDDGDGVDDGDDAFPLDPNESSDSDGDGVGDNGDQCTDTPQNESSNARGCSVSQSQHASCVGGFNLDGGRSYQVTLTSSSDETISFQVLEPTTFDCANAAKGAHPLVLHGHGFGGSRNQDGFDDLRAAGYTIISIDQRGFGDSSGTVRVMDPDFEGLDLIQILDWAEEHLEYLAWRNEGNQQFIAQPRKRSSVRGGNNLVVGAMGSSYGGGYQLLLHAVDEKNRLDALVPDITWHDLRYSLNPGDTLKTAWDLLLVAGGEAGSYRPGLQNQESPLARGLDLYIKETLVRGASTNEFPRNALEWFRYHSPTYWCGLNGEATRPYSGGESAINNNLNPDTPPGSNTRSGQAPVDVLLTQGFRDTLFNFNDAWWNYQCLRDRGGDVRLMTHQSGHILQGFVPAPGPFKFQEEGGNGNCGAINRNEATKAWFDEKLKGRPPSDLLANTQDQLCISLDDDDAVLIPQGTLLATRTDTTGIGSKAFTVDNIQLSNVPNGALAQQLYNAGQTFSVFPLVQVTSDNGAILAGIPLAQLTVSTPQTVNDTACAMGSVPGIRVGCDSISFVGLGVKRADSDSWQLIDDQIMPVRGIRHHDNIEMVGVAERLNPGDEIALLVYGYHPQYLASFSRDPSIQAVNLAGSIDLPLYASDDDGQPITSESAHGAVSLSVADSGGSCTDLDGMTDPACAVSGTAASLARTFCDYQWQSDFCQQFAFESPGYDAGFSDGPLTLKVGAVHEHSGYSDGDPNTRPLDYFLAGRTGQNTSDDGSGNSGVILDFMWSSEHTDNEKLPITTAAVCAPFADPLEDSNDAQSPEPLLNWLADGGATNLVTALDCANIDQNDHYFKWQATLEQAMAATERDEEGNYTGFTALRGFEWTNDFYNHLNVYGSTHVVNAKVDGSYADLEQMWEWLRTPVSEGGGADALVTFNHPGRNPTATPFDNNNPALAIAVTADWNDLAFVDEKIDARVIGMEIREGEDISYYIKALNNGWHIGALDAEDEHQREWANTIDGKTLILTRGRKPQDYYHALANRRTIAVSGDAISGEPGQPAIAPSLLYWADGDSIETGKPLGAIVNSSGSEHTLYVEATGLPEGAEVRLVNKSDTPINLGQVSADGSFSGQHTVNGPALGEDWYFVAICPSGEGQCGEYLPPEENKQKLLMVSAPIWFTRADETAYQPDYGSGITGMLAEFGSDMNQVLTHMLSGNGEEARSAFASAFANLGTNLTSLGANDPSDIPALVGLHTPPDAVATELHTADREVEPIILTGDKLPQWSAPSAYGYPEPYPSGADTKQCPSQLGAACPGFTATVGQIPGGSDIRNAHNGTMLHPHQWKPGMKPIQGGGKPINQIVGWSFDNGEWREIPVQVDERMPYFLANANSTFSVYSGTDEELTYVWHSNDDPDSYFGEEVWGMTKGTCERAYDPNGWDNLGYEPQSEEERRNRGLTGPVPDPIAGLDNDDEIVFMASDAGQQKDSSLPPNISDLQEVRIVDPLDPSSVKYVYLGLRSTGPTPLEPYISYVRDPDAKQWIDRSFFTSDDPEKLGSSNDNYGPNLGGTICRNFDPLTNSGTPEKSVAEGLDRDNDGIGDGDRFTRDGVTVTTENYQWYASGRWMVRSLKIRKPGESAADESYWENRPDLIDRWKGRAFQQSPDSTVSVVGFEDEQVNWEANAALLGERCGPVRCIRETWGADSGTNVTKTETFYRDAITYRYRVRVHPIPPDGLYTSWDYNRSAMLPEPGEAAEPGRYYTALRPQGVPIDGQNDDIGQMDTVPAIGNFCFTDDGPRAYPSGRCPVFFDTADPTFNLPLAFDNWEQVSGKGDSGSLVYSFELKGATSLMTPVVVPYYRDDACLDDGTGDDPVRRPYPGDRSDSAKVVHAYDAMAADGEANCQDGEKQGAYGAHGIHYFFTGDVDNAFVLGKPINEIDGQQWQFIVPTDKPKNVGTPYANIVRAPLQTIVAPVSPEN